MCILHVIHIDTVLLRDYQTSQDIKAALDKIFIWKILCLKVEKDFDLSLNM